MITDEFLDRTITDNLNLKNDEERASHVSSGKLTASMLGKSLQWQILKVIGVPPKELENYVLRKMLRGRHVEDFVTEHIKGLKSQQEEIIYKDTIGLIDALVDSSEYDFKCGIIPHEVKSVTNMKFKRIVSSKDADLPHRLQASLYALGLGVEYYAIDYVASDDYRILTWVYPVKDTKEMVDKIIDKFQETLKSGILPVFEPFESWQANVKYSDYPDWMNLTQEEVMEKLEKEYPENFKKLKEYNVSN